MSLASRWLDLDRIAGAGEGAGPLDSIVPLALRLRDLLPAEGRSRATFTIDQANIGREAVSDVRLSLAALAATSSRSRSCASACRAAAAASCRASSRARPRRRSSTAASACAAPAWCASSAGRPATPLPADAKGDGAFGVRAQLADRARPRRRAQTSSATCPAPRSTATRTTAGRAGRSSRCRSRARSSTRAPSCRPAPASPTSSISSCTAPPPAEAAGADRPRKPAGAARQTDALIRVNAGQLDHRRRAPIATWRSRSSSRAAISGCRCCACRGDDGFSLELEGEVEDAAAARPKGSLRGVVSAETRAGHRAAGRAARHPRRVPPRASGARRRWRRCASPDRWRSARARRPRPICCSTARPTALRVKLTARLDGGAGGWRTGPADVTGSVEGAEASPHRRAAGAGRVPDAATAPEPGGILVKAGGVPADGCDLASVEAGDVALSLPRPGGARRERHQGLRRPRDQGRATARASPRSPAWRRRCASTACRWPARCSFASAGGEAIALDRLALNVGGSDVRGQIALAPAGDRRRVEARLDVGRAQSSPGCLRPCSTSAWRP